LTNSAPNPLDCVEDSAPYHSPNDPSLENLNIGFNNDIGDNLASNQSPESAVLVASSNSKVLKQYQHILNLLVNTL
jgi:hypothetical protein